MPLKRRLARDKIPFPPVNDEDDFDPKPSTRWMYKILENSLGKYAFYYSLNFDIHAITESIEGKINLIKKRQTKKGQKLLSEGFKKFIVPFS